MENNPLISILMPVFNCEEFIDTAICSILNQTHTNWELILINDGSVDATLERVMTYQDPRIRIFSDKLNLGLPKRLNEAIGYSNGLFLARMDGDDAMFPERLSSQLKVLQENSALDVVGSTAVAFDKFNKIIGLIESDIPKTFSHLIVSGNCFIHPTVLAKREWFIKHLYDETIRRPEDLELWIRTYNSSSFYIIKTPLLFYRNPGVLPKWKYKEGFLNYNLILKKHKKIIPFSKRAKASFRFYIKYKFYRLFVALKILNRIHPLDNEMKLLYEKTLFNISK